MKNLSIHLDEKLYKQFKDFAKEQHRSMNGEATFIIKKHLEERREQKEEQSA